MAVVNRRISVAPEISLSYNSASVDGRTAATNNQSSWLGQGWNYEPGFVELIPATSGMDEMFTKYWRASVDWRGENPIRPFG